MQTVFLTTVALLTSFFSLRFAEHVRGSRFGERVRARLDTRTRNVTDLLVQRAHHVQEHINRDALVKVLHMLTYLALLCVRWLERKLTAMIARLRSFRKKKPARAISPGLDQVARGVDSE